MRKSPAKQAPQFLLCAVFMMLWYGLGAQVAPPNPLDGFPSPKPSIRTNDVVWLRTTWERIDLRQKANHRMYFPTQPAQGFSSLFDHMKHALLIEGSLKAYSTGPLGDDDMLTTVLNRDGLISCLLTVDTLLTPSLYVDGVFVKEVVEQWVGSDEIIAFDIKERWFIDVERSVMGVEIIAIAPVQAVFEEETGEFKGMKRLFWISYDDFRVLAAKWPVRMNGNELGYISYDDLFTKRQFSGTLIKVSTIYDRWFAEYLPPLEALQQAAYEWEDIRNIEQDLWNY